MNKAKITLNERSWAIEVITEINAYSTDRQRAIRRAGGEHSLPGPGGLLFPDVLLFGDKEQGLVLQGWELKLPDTSLADSALLENAEKKSRTLGLKSFVVWNVREAALYCLDPDGRFSWAKGWGPVDIPDRRSVLARGPIWRGLLYRLLDDLNDFFESRPESAATVPEVLDDAFFSGFINAHTPAYAEALNTQRKGRARLRSQIDQWWRDAKSDYPDADAVVALARSNILNWLNKIIFAQCMKRFRTDAFAVDTIRTGITVAQAQAVFRGISEKCNFMSVFQQMLGQEYVDNATFRSLVRFNSLLTSAHMEAVPFGMLGSTLEGVVDRGRRKGRGQFITPGPLADLLVRITLDDLAAVVLDPCCGTGSIVRAAYQWKKHEEFSAPDAISQIWASDKYSFPLQLATMALADPAAAGTPLNVFCSDALELAVGQKIVLTDPNTGQPLDRDLPEMDCIVSNLPFVPFERIESAGRQGNCAEMPVVDSRSDLSAYLILRISHLLRPGGRAGIIISNAWLGTEWGRQFRDQLHRRFHIRAVITSAAGRWFSSAAVVANILLLEKRLAEVAASDLDQTHFITTIEPLEKWSARGSGVSGVAAEINLADQPKGSDRIHVNSLARGKLDELQSLGLQWTAFFANLGFMDAVKRFLVPASTFFEIHRGERRGWDEMFFPPPGVGIETRFLRPVVKNSRNFERLVVSADAKAFCCSLSMAELHAGGLSGTVAWINQFARQHNGSGKPLTQVLQRSGWHWYEMRPETMADFTVPINPDSRLCVFRLKQRAFVNQRLIRLTLRRAARQDAAMLHALMNSSLGMLLLEGSGFGRGLGVLDLNATKLARSFHILDPGRIDPTAAERIRIAFLPLLARAPEELPDELARPDRQAFDTCVLDAYGVAGVMGKIREAVEFLYRVRKSARDSREVGNPGENSV